MSRFRTLLDRVGAGLALPSDARVAILEELADDLEDLYAAYRAEGHCEAEARARAEARLGPTAETVGALVAVHAPLGQRLLQRYGGRERRLERWALAGSTAIAAGSVVGLGAGAFADASPFLLPVAVMGAVAAAFVALKLLRRHLLGDARPDALAANLIVLPLLTVCALAVAALGVVFDLYLVAAAVERDPALEGAAVLRWVRQSTTLLAVALAIALAGSGAWFQLRRSALLLAADERRALARPGLTLVLETEVS